MFTGASTGLLVLGLIVALLVLALALRHAPQRDRRVMYVQSSRDDRYDRYDRYDRSSR
jgi:hypothetical protein